jgi:hypothetical protein
MKAVRAGSVSVADGGAHFSRPGPRLIDSLELLAETLHPSGEPAARGFERVCGPASSEPQPVRQLDREGVRSVGGACGAEVTEGREPQGTP